MITRLMAGFKGDLLELPVYYRRDQRGVRNKDPEGRWLSPTGQPYCTAGTAGPVSAAQQQVGTAQQQQVLRPHS